MKRAAMMIVAIVMIVIVVGGCGGNSTSAPTTDATTMDAAATKPLATGPKEAVVDNFDIAQATNLDADITIVQSLDMISWDPVNTSDLSNGYIINNVYSRLFMFDENVNGIPELCSDYEMVSDTEWHFTIYSDVMCHDGLPLTIDDVVHSLNRTKDGTAIGALFRPILEITKADDNTVAIITDGPYPALTSALTHQAACIVPQRYSDEAVANDDWSKPIGSGRYSFVERVVGESVKITRFDDYFNQDDASLNESLTFKVISEGTGRTIAIETGAADVNIDFDTIDYERVISNPDVQLWQHYSQTMWHLGMDNTHEWFGNKLVRQAVNYAIDRAMCMEVGHNGLGTVVYNCATFAPSCLGAVENPLEMYYFNPERARELMAEANCAGFDTEIIVFRDETERIAMLCQSNLADIGINAKVTRIDNALFSYYVATHKAPMFITSWGCFWDPDLFLARRFGEAGIGGVNRVWFRNEELEKLLVEGRSTFDEAARTETYRRVQELLAVEAPEADLYVSIMFALANKDLRGVELNVERMMNYYKLHY